jgi:hypothetical protein
MHCHYDLPEALRHVLQEYMRVRAKSIVRFDAGLDMRLHAKCRKSVAKFRTALFEVLTWLKVMLLA